MTYSELLQKIIGKDGRLSWGHSGNCFFQLNARKEDINNKIVDVGYDFVIIESSENIQGSRMTIPLNLFIINGDY